MSSPLPLSVPSVRCFVVCAALFLSILPFHDVRAQLLELKSWEVDESLAAKKADYFNAFKAGNVDSDREALERFFDKYYFARWTTLEDLGEGQMVSAAQTQLYARELIQDFRDATGNGREYLLKKSFETLQKMAADGNTHPSARYNAVMAIGHLAQRESTGRTVPPVLYAPSLPWLIAEYQKANSPEYLKLAALLGIVRHARVGIADETLKNETIPNLCLEIIETGKPAQGVTRETQDMKNWFRQTAMDALSGLRSAGPGGKTVAAMEAVMNDSAETLEIRTRAARFLGDVDYAAAATAGVTLNFPKLGTALLDLMKTMADAELQVVTQLRDKSRASKGYVSSRPGVEQPDPPFASLSLEQQIEIEGAVQSIKLNVQNIVYGMRGPRFAGNATQGILPMLPEDDVLAKKMSMTMIKGVNPLIKKLDEGPPEDEKKSAAASSMYESSEMMPGSGGGSKPKAKEEKQLKVNLFDIRNALQEFSTEMGTIISGEGA